MKDKWKREMNSQGFFIEILPVDWMAQLKQVAEQFYAETNDEVSKEAMDHYDFTLPDSFTACSIILSLIPGQFTPVHFQKDGKQLTTMLPPTYSNTYSGMLKGEAILKTILAPAGFHAQLTPCIPQKPLVAASGLGEFGRNNLTYVEGLGSFYGIATYYTDLPCKPKEMRPFKRMARCEGCANCQKHCPVQAVRDEGIIKAHRCITYFNEVTADEFPQWIPRTAHNYLLGCMGCQGQCPANAPYLGKQEEGVSFDEEETRQIFSACCSDDLSERTQQKLVAAALENYLEKIPRNASAVLQNQNK